MTGAERREPVDFLAYCAPETTKNLVLEEVVGRSGDAVLALHRLVKIVLLHALDNEAVTRTIASSHEILFDFAASINSRVSVTFVADTVFVNAQLLRASRQVYEHAMELEKLLRRVGVSEIAFEPGLTTDDVQAFAGAFVTASRDAEQRGVLLDAKIPHVAVRTVDPLLERTEKEDAPLQERVLRTYAASLLVMRQFFDGVAQGVTFMPHRVKRIAQKLVTLAEEGEAILLAMVTMAATYRDDAGRAVHSAILALVLGRQITTDRVTLARLVLAALMVDCGRVRLAGPQGRDRLAPLGLDDEESVPATTGAVCIATGGINVPNALRTTVNYEATWIEREELLGSLYGRAMAARTEASILMLARAFVDRLAPRDTSAGLCPMEAVTATVSLPNVDPVLGRLFVKALGIVPVGSVVEFETGEWAVVVGPSQNPSAFDRPRIRLVTDRTGRALEKPREIDLGGASLGRMFPRISHILPAHRARFNVTGALLAGTS